MASDNDEYAFEEILSPIVRSFLVRFNEGSVVLSTSWDKG